MRLQELYIRDYKALQDFTLTFDEQSAVSVLIGENGSGKTTVMECLTLIFAELFRQSTVSDLFGKARFPFAFRLRYRLYRDLDVDIDVDEDGPSVSYTQGYYDITLDYKETLTIRVLADNETVYDTPDRISTFLQNEGQRLRPVRYLFPANVVIYYSGISAVLDGVVADYEHDMIRGTLDWEVQANQDLFYFRPENFPALLIGLLSYRYGDVPARLETGFQITAANPFARIAITLRRPAWAKAKAKSDTFWGAKGDLATFLAVLRDRTDTTFTDDRITFTITTTDQLGEIWGFYGQEKSLFEYVVTLQANGLIERIDVNLHKADGLVVPYQRLSEGEKQLLIIMALRELLAVGENTLFLFDEPDTYLHPAWKRSFITDFLPTTPHAEQYLAYYLVSTHSPGLVSGMRQEQLHILQKRGRRSVLKTVSFNPYGKPEDQILFEFFGLDGLRFKPVQQRLEALQTLLNDGEYESDEFNERFRQLETDLGRGDDGLVRLKLEVARRKRAARPE